MGSVDRNILSSFGGGVFRAAEVGSTQISAQYKGKEILFDVTVTPKN